MLLLGTALALGLAQLGRNLSASGLLADNYELLYILGAIYLAIGFGWGLARGRTGGVSITWLLLGMGAYLCLFNPVSYVAQPIAQFSRSLPRGFWSNAVFQFADYIKVFFQTPPPLTAVVYTFLSLLVLSRPTPDLPAPPYALVWRSCSWAWWAPCVRWASHWPWWARLSSSSPPLWYAACPPPFAAASRPCSRSTRRSRRRPACWAPTRNIHSVG